MEKKNSRDHLKILWTYNLYSCVSVKCIFVFFCKLLMREDDISSQLKIKMLSFIAQKWQLVKKTCFSDVFIFIFRQQNQCFSSEELKQHD